MTSSSTTSLSRIFLEREGSDQHAELQLQQVTVDSLRRVFQVQYKPAVSGKLANSACKMILKARFII